MGIYPSPHTHPSRSILDKVALDKLGKKGLAQSSGASLHRHSGVLESGNLRVRTSLAAADDGTGVTHTATRGRTDTGDEADGRLVVYVVGLEELGGILLGTATNLTNHDDTLSFGVLEEDAKAVDEVGTGEGVTTDTDDERLAKTGLGRLVHGLIGEGTGTRDDTNTATLVDKSRHDTDLALTLFNSISFPPSFLLHMGAQVNIPEQ